MGLFKNNNVLLSVHHFSTLCLIKSHFSSSRDACLSKNELIKSEHKKLLFYHMDIAFESFLLEKYMQINTLY